MALLVSLPPLPKLISKPTNKASPFIPPISALTPSKSPSFTSKPPLIAKYKTLIPSSSSSSSFGDLTFDFDDGSLENSPWEGAVVYKRYASVPQVEYCIILERLGLGKLSNGVSKSRASAMGIRAPPMRAKEMESGGDGTPVLVSVDVARRKRRLKLDGIVRTVITLGCSRKEYNHWTRLDIADTGIGWRCSCNLLCGEPAAECIFANFSLLLTEDPIDDSDDEINVGVIYGEDKNKSSTSSRTEDEEENEKGTDLDDRLYFPSEQKETDISKPIRDLVHLEIMLNAICDANSKGLCLRCGTNLNNKCCNCSKEEVHDGEHGPLKNLRKQMQQR